MLPDLTLCENRLFLWVRNSVMMVAVRGLRLVNVNDQ